jgi:hypothetical protein
MHGQHQTLLIKNVDKTFYFMGVFIIFINKRPIMKKYALETRGGEKFSYVFANSLDEAKEIFSSIKKLPIKVLLEIFVISRVFN